MRWRPTASRADAVVFLRRLAIVVIDVARDNKGAFAEALSDDAYFHSSLGKVS